MASDGNDPDEALLAGVGRGDPAAVRQLLDRRLPRILALARRMLNDAIEAEDVAQEVVIQLWTALAGFAGTSLFTTWLYRIVVNRCLGTIRRRREDTPLTDPDIVSSPGADAQVMARNRLSAMLAAARICLAGGGSSRGRSSGGRSGWPRWAGVGPR